MVTFIAAVVVGVGLLAFAADQFVIGAARLAGILRLSPVVIGAVIVGFGTSAPEMLVSGIAAARDDVDVGVGNVVGSNVANLTLILGTAALLVPITVQSRILRREAPLSVASVLVFALFLLGGFRSWEGLVLLALLAVAMVVLLGGPGRGGNAGLASDVVAEFEVTGHRLAPESLRTLIGLVGTVAGAWALVWGAQGVAERAGLSGGFVGLSLVAVGTSLPELVTAVAAARHGEQELVVGNLLGSNLFNSLAVGGLIAVLAPGVAVEESLRTTGLAFMVVVAVVVLVLMLTRTPVYRIEGALLLATFVVFLVATYLTQPEAVEVVTAGLPAAG